MPQQSPIPPRHFVVGRVAIDAETALPGLHLVATPIGNLADITLRALNILAAADRIYCEDTRVTRKLLSRYSIEANVSPYHDHNAATVRPRILEALKQGATLALVSDAGTPLVSDPGYKLVTAALSEGIRVHMAPGPSAPLMALALSGLPSDRFLFLGFLPAKREARRKALAEVKALGMTCICFETAARLAVSLADIADILGDPPLAVARELTKVFEEVLRGRASAVARRIEERGGVKGEITIVVAPEPVSASEEAVGAALAEALARLPPAKAAAEVAHRFGRAKRELYARVLGMRGEM